MEANLRCSECKGKIGIDGKPIEEKYSTENSPNIATDAVVLRKHKEDESYDILLIKRKHEPFKDHFAFPGGFVDYNEDPIKGCLRELKEECDLDGQSIELLTVKSDPKRDPRKHIVSLVYLVEVSPDASPNAGDDAASAQFYDLKEILKSKDKMAFDHKEILEELLEKKLKNVLI